MFLEQKRKLLLYIDSKKNNSFENLKIFFGKLIYLMRNEQRNLNFSKIKFSDSNKKNQSKFIFW